MPTANFVLLTFGVHRSMMPKGVEHIAASDDSELETLVHRSMMPKGVEHIYTVYIVAVAVLVHRSMMPKGVEHLLL